MAVASLVLGLMSFMCMGPVLSLPAVITGHVARAHIKRSGRALTGDGMAVAGLVLGYVNLLLVLIVVAAMGFAVFLPATTRASEAAKRSSCQNNLKQLGLVLKMYANENKEQYFPAISTQPGRLMFDAKEVYPEYLTDAAVMLCPNIGKDYDLQKLPDPTILIDDESYYYTGYALFNVEDLKRFAAAYRERIGKGLPMNEDVQVSAEAGGQGGPPLFRLREGIEKRFAGTKSSDPSVCAVLQSTIPILIERPYNHIPKGGNVLFLDGHVAFYRYPGQWPMDEETMKILESLDAMKSGT